VERRPGGSLPRLDDITGPAWVWDADRARIVAANDAAIAYWAEPTLADLLAREFGPSDPMVTALSSELERLDETLTEVILPLSAPSGAANARCEAAVVSLSDGRQGLLLKIQGEAPAADPDAQARLAGLAHQAPVALMCADLRGAITAENDAARELFGMGREPALGQRMGSARVARALIEDCATHGRASRTRTIPTRFGQRLCRLTARRGEDPVTRRPSILVQAVDVEDERARVAEREADTAALADFLDASAAFYLELDYDLRVVRASDRLAETLGLGPAPLNGLYWRDLVAAQDVQITPEVDEAMTRHEPWSSRVVAVITDAGRVAYATSAHVIKNDRGDYRGYRIVAHEVEPYTDYSEGVTPLPVREDAGRHAAFAEMVTSAPWGVVVHRGFAPLYVNLAFVELFSLPDDALDEPARVPLFQIFTGAEEALREDAARLMADEMAFTLRELTVPASGGRDMLIQIRARRIDWQDGPAIEYTVEDVSTWRREGRDGAERAATMTAVLDMVPEAIFLLRGSGQIDWANLAAMRLLDLPDTGPAPHDISDVLGPEDTGWAQDYVAGLAEGGLTHLFTDGREVAVISASGRRIPALMALERIGAGKDAQVCAVLRDISEWRNAETKVEEARGTAEESTSRKTEFLAKVSHELRTPLTAILGFAQVMARQDLGPIGNPRYVEYAKDILDSGDHLLSLINDLLDMSKVESGKFDLKFDSVDVHDLAEGCVRLMSPIAGSRQVTLRHTVEDTLPSVVADERSMRQILLNLISNALRFTEAGGTVTVSAGLDESGGVVLAVTDTGVGMNEEELAIALEPFEQVEKEVASGTPGTGLGLPLARALTEANRAQFSIESTPRAGTSVSMTFASTQVLAD